MKFGAHMSTRGGVWKALERGASIDCEIVQIFAKKCRQRYNFLWFLTLMVVIAGCHSGGAKMITGPDGNYSVTVDSKNRVSHLFLHSDGTVRKGIFDYKGHLLELARFFDSQGKEVGRYEFTDNHTSASGADGLTFSSSTTSDSSGYSEVAEWKMDGKVIFKHVFVRNPLNRESHETFGQGLEKISGSE